MLVPCYTEALEIVTETVWAARMADIPAGCTATVWLLDDGNDAAKAAWVSGMADPNIRYISGRRRPRGTILHCSGVSVTGHVLIRLLQECTYRQHPTEPGKWLHNVIGVLLWAGFLLVR